MADGKERTFGMSRSSRKHTSRDLGRFVGAFFDELMRAGVRDVVVSPGSRSTPLSMVAYEASKRYGERLRLYLDVDERGAAFFGLGIAKATGRAVCVICTSGTALANYYPAVMEAEVSRVPLIVLSGDRPLRLQKLGAPQTCDQTKAFADSVRGFFQVPEPSGSHRSMAHVRQIAREALIAAAPCTWQAGPVHVNFFFDDPLTPNIDADDLFDGGRPGGVEDLPPFVTGEGRLDARAADSLAEYLDARRVIVLAGEGTLSPAALLDHARRDREAQALIAFAERFDAPLLADPLSQLRSYGHPAVIAGYDRIMGSEDLPPFDVVVRFGRYPVSKRTSQTVEILEPAQIVVDARATRDFNSQTTTFVKCDPTEFVTALLEAGSSTSGEHRGRDASSSLISPCVQEWGMLDRQRAERIAASDIARADGFEGAYVRELIDAMPPESLLFTANSMSVRAVDSFYLKQGKRLTVMANRGLNGIDGTTSTAIGAAHCFEQTVFLTGDLTLLHDLNALALQGEMLLREAAGHSRPSIVIVLLDNNGGAIFDMLPQRSEDPYFERLFLTPQQVDFEKAAASFGVPARSASCVEGFREALDESFGTPGLSLIRVPLALSGVRERYDRYW